MIQRPAPDQRPDADGVTEDPPVAVLDSARVGPGWEAGVPDPVLPDGDIGSGRLTAAAAVGFAALLDLAKAEADAARFELLWCVADRGGGPIPVAEEAAP